MEHITRDLNINKNRVTQLILLDLEKAFDSVWDSTLLVKLQRINTIPPLLRPIVSYQNRTFYVNRIPSIIRNVTAEVPRKYRQVLYSGLQNSHLAVYVDENAIFVSEWKYTNATKYIQVHLDQLQDYFTNWKLKINLVKGKPLPSQIRDPNPQVKSPSQDTTSLGSLWPSTLVYYYMLKSPGLQRLPKEQT